MSEVESKDGEEEISEEVKESKVEEKKKKRKRARNKENEMNLCEKIIELLRSEGFSVTPPEAQRSEEEITSIDKKIAEVLKTILRISNGEDIEAPKQVEKKEAKLCGLKLRMEKEADAERKARRLKKKEEKKKLKEAKKAEVKLRKKERRKEKAARLEDDEIEPEKKLKKLKKLEIVETGANASFPKYMDKREIKAILNDPESWGEKYVQGPLRINPKFTKHAYLTLDNNVEIMIVGVRDRNRALDRDIVLAMIKSPEEWYVHKNGEVQKTAQVVSVMKRVNPRKFVGTLAPHGQYLKLRCRDVALPMLIFHRDYISNEVEGLEDPDNTLFSARIDRWNKPYVCFGKIEQIMGNAGDLDVETDAILLSNGLDVTPYEDELLEGLPSSDYVPVASDLEDREDWREECVFTIDPSTAVDLDDAVSCKELPNGNFEVGVHISDVTHYLSSLSALNEKVAERATTIYLVNTVYHMLPKCLYQLCSLLPGQDKLTFSVVWEMTPNAEIIKHRFAKSVVRSCYQMSYEKAQEIIDDPTREWTNEDFPGLSGKFTGNDVSDTVKKLYGLSTIMRERRFDDGALSINQPKLQIILDRETKIPVSYRIEERRDSNFLIEEFMLLANMTVAKHLYEKMPDTAFLRIHGEPLKRVIEKTALDLGFLGVHLNTESAASLQSSLSLYEKTGLDGEDEKFVTTCRMMVINALCAQSMPRANYTCSGMIAKEDGLRHFALNVPFYTHFTSPIRRYADCVVHRLLFASLTNTPLPTWSADACAKIASNCNGKKYSAKIAQEKSNELYFMDLLSRKGPTETIAIVMKVHEHAMDVILCLVGITITLNYSDIKKSADVDYNKEHSVATLNVRWKESGALQVINVFSIVNLQIEKNQKRYAIRGVLLPSRLNETTTTS